MGQDTHHTWLANFKNCIRRKEIQSMEEKDGKIKNEEKERIPKTLSREWIEE